MHVEGGEKKQQRLNKLLSCREQKRGLSPIHAWETGGKNAHTHPLGQRTAEEQAV